MLRLSLHSYVAFNFICVRSLIPLRKRNNLLVPYSSMRGLCWLCPPLGLLGMLRITQFLCLIPKNFYHRSMILFLVSITSLIWTTGATDKPTNTLSSHKSFVPRLVTSLVLLLGVLYFIVIMIAFSRYGGNLDKAWVRRLQETHRWDESVPKTRPPLDQGLSGWRKALIRH